MGTPPPGPESNRIRVDKSPVFAFFLTFLFGPLGLLYVKVVPALVLILAVLGGYFTFGIGSTVARLVWIVAWIVSIVWACVEASRRHRAFELWRASTGDQGIPVPGYQQAAALRGTSPVRLLLFLRPVGTRMPPVQPPSGGGTAAGGPVTHDQHHNSFHRE